MSKISVRNLSRQAKPLLFVFLFAYAPALLILAAAVLAESVHDVPIAHFLRDTAAVARVPFYTGSISNMGIILWSATASVCLLTYLILRSVPHGAISSSFFLFAGALTTVLMCDDAFLLHEEFFPKYLEISNNIVFLFYIVFGIVFTAKYYKIILHSNYLLYFLAAFLFSLSVGLDKLHDFDRLSLFGVDSASTGYLLEDGFKFLGITGWFSFFVCTSYETLTGALRRKDTA